MQQRSNSNDILMGSCDPAKLMLKTAQMGVDSCLNLHVFLVLASVIFSMLIA